MVRTMTDRSFRLANRRLTKESNYNQYLINRVARVVRRNNWKRDSFEEENYFHNTTFVKTYKMGGSQNTYGQRLLSAGQSFWRQIPKQWKAEKVNIYLYYDFYPSEHHGHAEWGLGQKTQQLVEGSLELEEYLTHSMTRLDADDLHEDRGSKGITKSSDFLRLIHNHLLNRIQLEELYLELDTNIYGENIRPEYHTPNHVTFKCHRRRYDTEDETMGDRHTNLFKKYLTANDSENDCVWRLIQSQMSNTRYPITYSVEEMIKLTGLKSRVSLDDLDIIENKIKITHGKKKELKDPHSIGIVIFDARLNLRRLPRFQETNKCHNQQKYLVYGVMHNGHAYGVSKDNLARDAMKRDLTYYESFLKCAEWPNTLEDGYEKSWDLFRETQHLQPDRASIKDYIINKLDLWDDCIELKRVSKHKTIYVPWFEISGQNTQLCEWMKTEGLKRYMALEGRRPAVWYRAVKSVAKAGFISNLSNFKMIHGIGEVISEIMEEAPWKKFEPQQTLNCIAPIEAKGLNIRCKELNIEPRDLNKVNRMMDQIKDLKLTLPKVRHDMTQSLAMDLETASVKGTNGTFLVYAVGYRYEEEKTRLVAQSYEDLHGDLLWTALLNWEQIAAEMNAVKNQNVKEGEKEKEYPLYIYAHNGSRFDAISAIHTILSKSGEVPSDQLESNGKFISFRWRRLIFRDSCLITMSSLSAACNSFGLRTKKTFLPHRYFQNCENEAEVLNRLHGSITWRELEPYMDWFSECKEDALHTRIAEKSWEQWRNEQEVYKFWIENCDKSINVKDFMGEYLSKDVDALYELCEKLGDAFARDLGADIRQKCTLGSCAEHMWQHTLLKPIPKLQSHEEHLRWQKTNRGGFCGPLHKFDYSVKEKQRILEKDKVNVSNSKCASSKFENASWKIYKVDITSLYPASTRNIKYITKDGLKTPLNEWYRGFPDPTNNGWKKYDFNGEYMTDAHYDFLSNLHGDLRIEFDQSSLKFPFFLKKMKHKQFETLAPVLKGGENYTIPHIRMAYKYGVKIRLFDAQFTKDSWEPYNEYIEYFEKMKNDADFIKSSIEKKYEKNETWSANDISQWDKAVYDRTIAKLFLNGLLGRNNMRLDRKQTMLTQSFNDIISLQCDNHAYRSVDLQEIQCDEKVFFKASFKEGEYEDNIDKFNVVPYLSAYMLGYSKMLMQASFQFISQIGGDLLYTDTDSIVFAMSEESFKRYENEFIPIQKSFGGMELEGVYERFVCVGPKKYICIKPNGDYEWHCNGMPARHNTKLDVLNCFEKVLQGETQSVPYFSINAMTNFELRHTTGATKQMRFLALKGAVENGMIRFWKDEQEFVDYCHSIQLIGSNRIVSKTSPPKIEEIPAFYNWNERECNTNFDDIILDYAKNIPDIPQAKRRKIEGIKTDKEQASFCYILTDIEGYGDTYTGFTVDLENRLNEHNTSKGANSTKGKKWKYWRIFGGFKDRRQALRFEAYIHRYRVDGLNDMQCVYEKVLSQTEYNNVTQIDVEAFNVVV